MLASLALLAALAGLPAPCKSSSALAAYVEADAVTARDTVMVARLCLSIPAKTQPIASLSGRLALDTGFAKMISLTRPSGSPFITNADSAGNIMVAGASGSGLSAGPVVTVRLRLVRRGVVPRIDLDITELNARDGTSFVTRATTQGLAPRCAGSEPAVFEVLPPAASTDPGEPLDLRINGCGFDPTRNTIRVGDITVRDIRSTEHGTRIRVIVPKEHRSTGEVPPMLLSAGVYDVSVDNGRGRSNARRITLR